MDVDPAHEEEFNRWYNESHVPNLRKVPGYVLAGRFRALDHPAVKNFNTGHRYLAIYEHESEEIIPSLRDRERMSPRGPRRIWYVGERGETSHHRLWLGILPADFQTLQVAEPGVAPHVIPTPMSFRTE